MKGFDQPPQKTPELLEREKTIQEYAVSAVKAFKEQMGGRTFTLKNPLKKEETIKINFPEKVVKDPAVKNFFPAQEQGVEHKTIFNLARILETEEAEVMIKEIMEKQFIPSGMQKRVEEKMIEIAN